MDIKKALLVKYFRKITNNYNLPQSQQLTQATDIQEEEIRMTINYRNIFLCALKLLIYVKHSHDTILN